MTFSADELEDGARAATGSARLRLALLPRGSRTHRRCVEHRGRPLRHGSGDTARHHQQRPHSTAEDRGHTTVTTPRSTTKSWAAQFSSSACPAPERPALSQLVAADPQFRSLRMWESQAPTPPPEAATQHTDPRIAQAEAGLRNAERHVPVDEDAVQLRSDRRDANART